MNKLNNPFASLREPSAITKEEFLRSASTNVAITEPTVSVVKESNVVDLDALLKKVEETPKKEILKPETTLMTETQRKRTVIGSKTLDMTKSAYLAKAQDYYFENVIAPMLEGK